MQTSIFAVVMDDCHRSFRQIEAQENVLQKMQNIHMRLQETAKKAKQQLDDAKLHSEKAEHEMDKAYLDCKNSVSSLGQNLQTLHQQCLDLSGALCPKEPQLLCQMPLDELCQSRKTVESNLKLLIVKQFQKKLQQDSPKTDNPYLHLLIGPDKKKFDQHCRDLEKLQVDYGRSLASLKILDAKNIALKAAINFIKHKNSKAETNLPSLTTSVKTVEREVKESAAKAAANKANVISLANLAVKQNRLHYYLDCLESVQQIMKKQIGIDSILCNMILVESEITQEANHFLGTIGKHFKTEVENIEKNIEGIVIMRSAPVAKATKTCEDDPLLEDFCVKSSEIIDQLNEHTVLLRKRALLLSQTESADAAEFPMLESSVSQLEKLHTDFKSEFQSSVLEFRKTKERLKLCQHLKPPIDLWQAFLVNPDKLSAYSTKTDD
ncbi:uncharacterized protein LOC132198433 [Neocloeon triangulifer]|uniref:uncharacterized protein LOC132198433 n=1 Tax=Neocloeon triangulifer TaxID=2078957 RepID=UPI00286F946C|nr:uncharacterized protein LOC132198433 [Neocloeon triangulifer]XP_059478465.1 uncharacterized protein LOC132198433 [Neocloeon triangulifer]XP_059478467.1 uncharacterized protein LOC132198433 [Neocloeon triangulifer]